MHDEEFGSPPPSYLQQQFDRKVSDTLAVSLTLSAPTAADEEWEEWDDNVLDANPPPTVQSHTHLLPTQVNSHKRAVSASSTIKPRPSWYEEAQLNQSSLARASSDSASSSRQREIHLQRIREMFPDEDQGYRVHPPPSFTPSGPSLDGPPFEEVEGSTMNYYQAAHSRSPSPLRSPNLRHSVPLGRSSSPKDLVQWGNQSPQRHSGSAVQSAHSHSLSYPRPFAGDIPVVEFDNSMAYNSGNPEGPAVVDATAFYNSAVVPHLSRSAGQAHKSRASSYSAPHAQNVNYTSRPGGVPSPVLRVASPTGSYRSISSSSTSYSHVQPHPLPSPLNSNATQFPRNSTYNRSAHRGSATPRWATSEQQFT